MSASGRRSQFGGVGHRPTIERMQPTAASVAASAAAGIVVGTGRTAGLVSQRVDFGEAGGQLAVAAGWAFLSVPGTDAAEHRKLMTAFLAFQFVGWHDLTSLAKHPP